MRITLEKILADPVRSQVLKRRRRWQITARTLEWFGMCSAALGAVRVFLHGFDGPTVALLGAGGAFAALSALTRELAQVAGRELRIRNTELVDQVIADTCDHYGVQGLDRDAVVLEAGRRDPAVVQHDGMRAYVDAGWPDVSEPLSLYNAGYNAGTQQQARPLGGVS